MADYYSPEDLQRIAAEHAYNLERNIPISKELAMEFANAKVGVKNYHQELNNSLKKLGSGLMDTVGALKDGKQGAAVFSKGLVDGADALESFLSRFGILGEMLGKLLTAGARYADQAAKQSDVLFKSYQDLSRFGAATSKGMSDVFPTMQKFGYNIEELDKMMSLLKENSKSLALYSGTVSQGSAQLANVAKDFKESGEQVNFRKMGMSVDDINRGIAGYYKQLGTLGQLQGKTQADVSKGAAEYIKQFEILTRLTGQNREEMEQQRQQALRIDEFNSTIMDLGKEGADAALEAINMLNAIDPSLAKGLAESFSGFITGSKDQDKLLNLTNMRLFEFTAALKEGGPGAAGKFMDSMREVVESNKPLIKSFGQLGMATDYFGPMTTATALWTQQMGKGAKTAEGQIKVDDKLTTVAVDLRTSQMATTAALQSMINDGVLPATEGLLILADAAKDAAEATKSGWDKFWGWFSGDKKETPEIRETKRQEANVASLDKATAISPETAAREEGRQKAEEDLKRRNENRLRRKQGLPPIEPGATQPVAAQAQSPKSPGTAPAQAPTAPGTAPTAPGTAPVAPADVAGSRGIGTAPTIEEVGNLIKFAGGKTGNKSNFDSMSEKVKDAFMSMVKEYGKSVTINSAKRDPADQQRLYDLWVANGGGPDKPIVNVPGIGEVRKPTKPGTRDSHIEGRALDLDTASYNGMLQQSLFSKYGFSPVPGDPGHIQRISAREGFDGLLSGPASGYKPDLTMHGTEQLSIKPVSTPSSSTGFSDNESGQLLKKQLDKMDRLVQIMDTQTTSDLMSQQLNRLDELVRVMQNQVNVSTKILQQSR